MERKTSPYGCSRGVDDCGGARAEKHGTTIMDENQFDKAGPNRRAESLKALD
jgi:hypothetical protein